DDLGEVHISEGAESVPPKFRPGATVLGYPSAAAPAPAPRAVGAAAGAATPAAASASDHPVLARVTFVPGGPILVPARINGGRSRQLVLDTGADKTMISPRALSALGVSLRPLRRGSVRGVGGVVEVDTVVLESIEVDGAKVGPIEVVA